MLKSAKVNILLVFITIALGGLIYFIFSNDVFNLFASIPVQKTKTLIGLLCATSYYIGVIMMMAIQKVFPDFK